MIKVVVALLIGSTVAFAVQSKPAPTPKPKAPAPTFKDIQPIFQQNCIGCHSGERAKAGIDFSTYASVMEGSDDGPIVNKGAPKHSLLVRALHGDKVRRMPPGPNPLAEQKIALIEKWILTGAKEK